MGWQDDPIVTPTAQVTAAPTADDELGGQFRMPSSSGAAVPAWQNDAPASAADDELGGQFQMPSRPADYINPREYKNARKIDFLAGIAGAPRATADINKAIVDAVGLPKWAGTALNAVSPVTLFGSLAPGPAEIANYLHETSGLPKSNTPGQYGPAIDAGVNAAVAGGLTGGGLRAMAPAFLGGAGSEAVGSQEGIKGTKWEAPARLITALFGGLGGAAAQNVGGNVARGAANLVGANARAVEPQAANIVGRALANDKLTMDDLIARQGEMPGTPLVVGGGENTKGALRGSIMAPGEARTTVHDTFDKYEAGGEGRMDSAISGNVSDKPPLSTRINDLQGERSAASGPAYEAAGVPSEPRMVKFAIDQPPSPNSRIIKSPAIDSLIADSKDVQTAIANARRLPAFKDQPANSMSMLDRVYKHLGGLEQEQIRGGNGTKANDIKTIRLQLRDAITEQNPAYGRALAAYSEPSALIDAANQGRDVFRKNVPPDETGRMFNALPDDQKREFLGGVAEHLRAKMGNSDRGQPAERILNSGNERGRLENILSPEDNARLNAIVNQDKTMAQLNRDVTKGSRTIPAGEEANANRLDAGAALSVIHKVADGHFGLAALDLLKGVGRQIPRITEGRTAAVNAKVAEMLTASDPEKIGLVRGLAERARQQALQTQQGRRGALIYGSLAPTLGAIR